MEDLWTPTAVEKGNNALAKLLHIQFLHTYMFTEYFPGYKKTRTTSQVSNSIELYTKGNISLPVPSF